MRLDGGPGVGLEVELDKDMPFWGKEKEERSFALVDFEVDKEVEETEDTDAFRECERVWLCLGWLMANVDGRPFPSLKDSN